MSIKFITDSASDMCEKDGVTVVPMTITFGNDEYKDGVTLSHREFYEKLIESDELPRTSQVSPYDFETSIGEAVADGSEVIVVTMASGLSGTYQSAVMAADKFDGVYVVDSESVTIGEIILIKYGMQLAKDGCSAAEIVEKLNECKKKIHIIALLDTLEYLKKGGRITPAAAAIGTVLNLKPVLQIQGEKLDAFAKARTTSQGKTMMINAIKKDINERFGGMTEDKHIWLQIAYTHDRAAAEQFRTEVEAEFPGYDIHIDPLSLSVACHIGPGALALACCKKITV